MRVAFLAFVEGYPERLEDAFAQLVLNGEEILHGRSRRFRPENGSGWSLDQLAGQSKAVAGAKQRSGEEGVDVRFNRYTPRIGLAFEP
jgi:hypothetical protein